MRYEVAILAAAFGVAVGNDLLAARAVFQRVEAGEKRTGVLEAGEFAAVIVELPAPLAVLVRFLYLTGWRRGEGARLTWAQVDWDDPEYREERRDPLPGPRACIRIGGTQSKGGDSRAFPFPTHRRCVTSCWLAGASVTASESEPLSATFGRPGRPPARKRARPGDSCTTCAATAAPGADFDPEVCLALLLEAVDDALGPVEKVGDTT